MGTLHLSSASARHRRRLAAETRVASPDLASGCSSDPHFWFSFCREHPVRTQEAKKEHSPTQFAISLNLLDRARRGLRRPPELVTRPFALPIFERAGYLRRLCASRRLDVTGWFC